MLLPSNLRKRAKDEENKAEREMTRANAYLQILRDVNRIILDGTGKLHASAGFFREIERLRNYKEIPRVLLDSRVLIDPRGVVGALIKELEIHINETRNLKNNVDELRWDIDAWPSETHGVEIEAIQGYQGMIAGESDAMSNEIQKLQDEIKKRDQSITQFEEHIHNLEAERLRIEDDRGNLISNYEDKMAKLIYDNKKKLEEMNEAHKSAETHLGKVHVIEIENLQKGFETEKSYLRRNLEEEAKHLVSKIEKLKRDFDAEKNSMQTNVSMIQKEYESEIVLMSREHESKLATQMSQMGKEHESKLAQLITHMSQMEKEHDTEKEKIRYYFEEKVETLDRAHAKDKEQLRKDIDEYSRALLARDNFQPISDSEIEARFLDLVQDVDALARLDWKVNDKEWTSQVLHRLSTNQRLLKKQFLQDSIWVILYEYIFCSPFRIFGEEGQSLETQWNGEYKEDSQLNDRSYTWPKPEIETERWRYVTIKECRAALRQPVPSEWDPRAKLKKGFKTSIDALRKELTLTISESVNLDTSSVQAIERMTLKAASMWLEFGMQRCRILVLVQGSNLKSLEEKIKRAQEHTLKLVLVPELKKFGNSNGHDLDVEETGGDWDGKLVELSMQ